MSPVIKIKGDINPRNHLVVPVQLKFDNWKYQPKRSPALYCPIIRLMYTLQKREITARHSPHITIYSNFFKSSVFITSKLDEQSENSNFKVRYLGNGVTYFYSCLHRGHFSTGSFLFMFNINNVFSSAKSNYSTARGHNLRRKMTPGHKFTGVIILFYIPIRMVWSNDIA